MAEEFTIRQRDGARIIQLQHPIEGPGKQITTIILRKPKFREVMNHGDPASLIVFADSKSMLPHEDMAIVNSYVSILAGDQDGDKILPDLLDQCDYRDALALTSAVVSFFKAEKTPEAKPSSPPSEEASGGSSLNAGSE